MANQISKSAEKKEAPLRGPEAPGIGVSREKSSGKEIKETAKELIEGVSEVVEGAEAAEVVEGRVGETTKEGKKKTAGGIKTGVGAVAGLQKVSAPPTIEIMRIQVSTQIKNEIRILEKEAVKLMTGGANFQPFKLNGIVAKIRELKNILANLAYASVETIKGWWMRFVKDITI